ncbi:DASS family sodium-coupled anion symporter [Clostridium sp. HV4-5-A1G]|uniref:DASS family sodium-coupled anion symporter n=1 Tax=Clostridium sp. HV4-5-A1G TaxID=2004595 RepID=UPI00123A18D5|nr:DASS family sodium-coupled anion symporter [Clostridium sp. HV4-5-A1G]KAA8669671.1 DASS family sodium-coupled anion symporter [Clostridium sp. HV4-5-A1G]
MNNSLSMKDSSNIKDIDLKPNVNLRPLILSIIIGLIIWFMPRPAAVPANGWHLLAIFISIIIGCTIKAFPIGLGAFVGIFTLTATKIITIQTAFSAYSESIIWFIVCAFALSIGVTKTGLDLRLAYNIIKKMGSKTIGAGYTVELCELILAILVPANVARSAGIVRPIAVSLSKSYGSNVGDGTENKAGSFLTLVGLHSNLMSGFFFLTSTELNLLSVGMAKALGVTLTLGAWFKIGIVPTLLGFIIVPLVLYFVCPPEIKGLDNVKEMSRKKLEELGPIKKSEKIMIFIFAVSVFLWIFGPKFGLNATVVAVLSLILLMATGIVDFKEFAGKKEIWDIFIWLGGFMMMSNQLSKLGVIKWISDLVKNNISGMPWMLALFIICLVMYYSHYLFASNTVHISTLYPGFLTILLSIGAPPQISAFLMTSMSVLSSGLTHYGSGQTAAYFGTGYVKQKKWWSAGLAVSIAHFAIWIGAGLLWWKILGMY